MANELTFNYLDAAGSTAVAAILFAGTNVINRTTGATIPGVPTNLATAAIPMSDAVLPNRYVGTIPGGIAPRTLDWGTYLHSGTSFTLIGNGSSFAWDGTNAVTLGTLAAGVNITKWNGNAVSPYTMPLTAPIAEVSANTSAGATNFPFTPLLGVSMPANFDCTFTIDNTLSPVVYTGTVRAAFGQNLYVAGNLQSSVLQHDPVRFVGISAVAAAGGSSGGAVSVVINP